MNHRARSSLYAYGGALCLVFVAILVRWLLNPWLDNFVPYITLYGAIAPAAWYAGWRPAGVAALVGYLVTTHLFGSPGGADSQQFVGFTLYGLSCGLIIAFVGGVRAAQQQARRNEQSLHERFVELLEGMDEGIVIFDQAWRHVYLNRQAERHFNRDRSGVLGKTLYELFPTHAGTLFEKHYRRAMSEQSAVRFEAASPITGRRLDTHVHPLHGGLAVLFRDITARHAGTTALKLSEERFRMAAEAMNAIVYDIDFESGHVLRVLGLRAVLGYAPDEVPSTLEWWHEQIHPDDLDMVLNEARRPPQGTERCETEYRIRHKAGHYVYLADRSLLTRDAQGRVTRKVGCCQDVSAMRRTEEALRQSEERFRSLVSATTSIIWTTDAIGRFVVPQSSWASYTGQSWEEYRGFGWLKAVHPDDRKRILAAWEDALGEGRGSYIIEGRVWHTATRSYRHFEARGVAMRNPDGTVREWVGKYMDIEDRIKASLAMQESEAKFRSIFEMGVIPMAFWHVDGYVTDANDAYLQLVEGNRADLQAGKVRWDTLASPDDLEGRGRAFAELMEQGYCVPYEQEFVLPSGHKVPVLTGGSMISPSTGIGFALDLTERKRSEEALRSTSQRVKLLVDNTPLAVIEWDRHLCVTGWSGEAEKVFGLSGQEVMGRHITELDIIYEGDSEQVAATIKQLMTGRNRYVIGHNRNWTRQRRIISCEWYNSVLVDDDGQTEAVLSLVLDVTERKRLEDELRLRIAELAEADQRKDEFLALLAHELRNPLAPIRNAVQLLSSRNPATILKNAREIIDRQVRQMTRLVDDLMDVSRITRGKINLQKERLVLATVIMNALESSRPLLAAAQHRFTLDLPEEPIPLDGDATRLAQIFLNLLNNAAKYTPPGGTITLSARRDGDVSVVSVRDSGIGIPAEQLPHIFGMFMQVDRSLERQHGGLGIGLTLVKRLVHMHGGSVEARSDGPGTGSEFIVRLPVASTNAPAQTALPGGHVNRDAPPGVQRRILVVDDNKDSAESLTMILGMMGHVTHIARDGLEAVEMAAMLGPEVILLDIGLPKLNGYDAATRIRALPEGHRTVLIAVTGWGQEQDKRRAREAGFDWHLVKPIDTDALKHLLAKSRPHAA